MSSAEANDDPVCQAPSGKEAPRDSGELASQGPASQASQLRAGRAGAGCHSQSNSQDMLRGLPMAGHRARAPDRATGAGWGDPGARTPGPGVRGQNQRWPTSGRGPAAPLKDTVSKQRQDDEVAGREHAFADSTLRLDPVVHHGVPVLPGQDLRKSGVGRPARTRALGHDVHAQGGGGKGRPGVLQRNFQNDMAAELGHASKEGSAWVLSQERSGNL